MPPILPAQPLITVSFAWPNLAAEAARLVALGALNDLDAGIRSTVALLRAHGFDTCDSGDGSKAGTMEGALDVPHVFIASTPETLIRDADRLRELVAGIPHAEIQATYDPKIAGRGAAVLALTMVCDADLLPTRAAPDSITVTVRRPEPAASHFAD